MDYGKSGAPKNARREPRNKTVNEHPKGKPGGTTDKAALLERMKKAAEKAKGEE
ncbi:MAG: hypothetical protein ACK4GT_19090 [Pararhodobacter sp.]